MFSDGIRGVHLYSQDIFQCVGVKLRLVEARQAGGS